MDTEREIESLFRPIKRRRHARKRSESQEEEPSNGEVSEASLPIPDEYDKSKLAQLLRARKADRSRRHGVTFTNAPNIKTGESLEASSASLVRHNPEAERLKAISDRFVPHTGQPVDVDKHMFVTPISPCYAIKAQDQR